MPPLEEIPCMVQLDAPQLQQVVSLIIGAESIVGGSCCEDGSHANSTSDESIVLAPDGIQDGSVENGHEVGREDGIGEAEVLLKPRASRIYTLGIIGRGSVEGLLPLS